MTADEVQPAHEPRPARGYSWPPFAPGHELSLRHGAWSDRKVQPIADQYAAALLAHAASPGAQTSYLVDPSYGPAIRRWAVSEARCELLRSYLEGLTDWETGQPGEIDADGEVRPAAKLLLRLEVQAHRAAARLGLDPLSRSKLGRDLAATQADLAQVHAAGAAALAARAVDTTATAEPNPEEETHDA